MTLLDPSRVHNHFLPRLTLALLEPQELPHKQKQKAQLLWEVADSIEISVIVCTYNRVEPLRNALNSLVRQEPESRFTFEIVVIDDGSTDRTEDAVRTIITKSPTVPIRYIHHKGVGIADARNRGVMTASGKWIAFFDDDQWAEPDWLAELYRIAVEVGVDCVGGGVVLDLPDSIDMELNKFCRSLLSEKRPLEGRAGFKNLLVGTGNILILRNVFERVGMFDNQMNRGSDRDFFWRALKMGVKMWYAPKAIVHHIIPESRLTYEHFKGLSLSIGLSNALLRYKYKGRLRWFFALVRWVFRALARDVWILLLSYLVHNKSWHLDRKCRLWITVGYVRGSMPILAPRLFRQKRFYESLNLRR